METDWTALLAAKGLEAPGYQETLKDMRDNPKPNPKRRTSRTRDTRRPRYPSAKHTTDLS